MVVPYLAVVTRVQAQETEGKAIIENIIVLGDSILSLGELSDVEKIMKPFGFKVTMFAVGNAAELYPGSTLRGCEPLAVRHSLGVFHRSGCAL